MTTVALDLVRATPGLRSEVMRLVAVAGLRPTRVVITLGHRHELGPCTLIFPIVDIDAADDATIVTAMSACVPRDRVAPAQWSVEERSEDNLHAHAVGTAWWLTVSGDLMPIVTPAGPPGGQAPPAVAAA